MTLQDYINLSQDSLNAFFSSIGDVITNVVAAIITLVVGVVIGAILKRVLVEILKAINFDRMASNWAVYQSIVKSHGDISVSSVVGELIRWVSIIIFLIPAVAALQIEGADAVVATLLGYLPNVLLASLYLLLGFVFAWFIHRVVMGVGVLVGTNPSHLIANVAYISIVVFSFIQALLTLGVGGEVIRVGTLLSLAAVALAVALGGKDSALDLVKKFMEKAKQV